MYRFRITIDEITPPIWRLVAIPETFSLNKLHHIIQIDFGWTNVPIYCFLDGDPPITDPRLLSNGTTQTDKQLNPKIN
ncbi:MAG: hypothetical protein NTX61_05425 [Bacteroidetes bacterium]|nr:hypothetical protein [Bacteroidota bacterium]